MAAKSWLSALSSRLTGLHTPCTFLHAPHYAPPVPLITPCPLLRALLLSHAPALMPLSASLILHVLPPPSCFALSLCPSLPHLLSATHPLQMVLCENTGLLMSLVFNPGGVVQGVVEQRRPAPPPPPQPAAAGAGAATTAAGAGVVGAGAASGSGSVSSFLPPSMSGSKQKGVAKIGTVSGNWRDGGIW